MIEERIKKGKKCDWETGRDVMQWWIGENYKKREIEGQCSFFGD